MRLNLIVTELIKNGLKESNIFAVCVIEHFEVDEELMDQFKAQVLSASPFACKVDFFSPGLVSPNSTKLSGDSKMPLNE